MIVAISKIATRGLDRYPKKKDIQPTLDRYKIDYNLFKKQFAVYLGLVIRDRIQQAVKKQLVIGQPMSDKYKPLSKAYNDRKPKKTRDRYYENTGWLIKHLKMWQEDGTVYIGYTEKTLHPSGVPAQDIILWLEKGTKYIPARPLFRPVFKFVTRHIDEYLENFIKNYTSLARLTRV